MGELIWNNRGELGLSQNEIQELENVVPIQRRLEEANVDREENIENFIAAIALFLGLILFFFQRMDQSRNGMQGVGLDGVKQFGIETEQSKIHVLWVELLGDQVQLHQNFEKFQHGVVGIVEQLQFELNPLINALNTRHGQLKVVVH